MGDFSEPACVVDEKAHVGLIGRRGRKLNRTGLDGDAGRVSWGRYPVWPDLHLNITNLGAALNVLTAMITPALLLSATGTYILSTSNRLARIVDRIRSLTQHVEELGMDQSAALRDERIERYRGEIKMQSKRLRLIQTALTMLYFAAVMFVCTSIAIGVVSTVSLVFYWVPVAFGITGACLMLVAAVALAFEARQAVQDLYEETEFYRRFTRLYVRDRGEPPTIR